MPPELVVGLEVADDAAVYAVAPDMAIVQTLDFFPPIVDDAYASGQIGAANSMSDVYAMGGEVLFALNIAAWPEDVPVGQLEQLFAGAVDKVREAGGVVAGGHTIIDREPKFGQSVTGRVDPARMLLKSRLLPGDELWLTKPIGTGILTTAHKRGTIAPEDLASVIASMSALNRSAAQAAVAAGLHAGTDITGFGLAGHAHEMAERSGVEVRIDAAAVPLLPGAFDHAEAGVDFGGMQRNREHFLDGGLVRFEGLDEATTRLMLDPQTSGGLLVGVPAAHRESFEQERNARDVQAWRIGEVREGRGVVITAGG
ncbi:MAG: selenide, water dikinase SelD [Chloroflexi bacterium RIFCSPLOWO2_12_FULL_71_12]|nr:MAG: selenide, water dikinase SelD [Chloroflexi bacterium RIFCSPLOWO2_12_FULL_71_12]